MQRLQDERHKKGRKVIYTGCLRAEDADNDDLNITRDIGRGRREILESSLPAVVTVKGDNATLPYASIDRIIDSLEGEIEVKSLFDLNLNPANLKTEPACIHRCAAWFCHRFDGVVSLLF